MCLTLRNRRWLRQSRASFRFACTYACFARAIELLTRLQRDVGVYSCRADHRAREFRLANDEQLELEIYKFDMSEDSEEDDGEHAGVSACPAEWTS